MNQCISGAEIRRASIAAAVVGDNPLVAAAAGKKIRVISACLSAAVAGTVRFESSTGDNFLSGIITLAVGVPLVLPENETGWFETALGESLNLITTGASQVASGFLTYQLIGEV